MFWHGFFESVKGFLKWREARASQKKRFNVVLADAQAIALAQELVEVRATLKGHVVAFHDGEKPVKPKREKLQDPATDYPLTEKEMEVYIDYGRLR